MNSIFRLTFTGILVGLVVSSCAHRISQPKTTAAIPGPHCIVYKTRADYSKLVPVILSADKSKIVSYPDVKDINNNGNFPYPSPLKKGYLLDNRGIGPDVAFIRLTYEEFARLKATPPAADLYRGNAVV